jgi:flagellar protein FlbD
MITLTRLNGTAFALNCDLIERVETTPDTVLVLLDGSRYLVAEPMTEVVSRIRHHRAEVIAMCHDLQEVAGPDPSPALDPGQPPALRVVTDER